MAALGIPTTRALAAVATGDEVMRETYLPGAVLTRVASSHIRVGSFQFFAARGDVDAVRTLADYAIARHYPDAAGTARPVLAFLEAVIARQANLIAKWLLVGFVHGVINTDNTSIAGETIDYGPCAFIDAYDPAAVFSSIDQTGRYAYGNQPAIAQWNLTRLGGMPAAAPRRGRGGQDRRARRRRRWPASRRGSTTPTWAGSDASWGCRRRGKATSRWRRTCWRRMAAGPRRLHPRLPPPVRRGRGSRRRRRGAQPVRRPGVVRRVGRALAPPAQQRSRRQF